MVFLISKEIDRKKIVRFVDLIDKKKKGLEHTNEEISFIVNSIMNATAEDYQVSAWLMAVYFKGMTLDETANLTKAMQRIQRFMVI
jgi:pyrimidine-nucleoside phosphorylase